MKMPELRDAMTTVFHRVLMEAIGHIQSQIGPVLEPGVDAEESALFWSTMDLYLEHQKKVGNTRDLLMCIQQIQATYDHLIHAVHSGTNDPAALTKELFDPVLDEALRSLQGTIDKEKLSWVAEEILGKALLQSLFAILVKKMGSGKAVEWFSLEVAKLAFHYQNPS